MGHARKEGGQRGDAACLGAPAGDPVDVVEAGQGAGGGGGVGGFAVVHERHLADFGHGLLAMRQAGEALEGPGQVLAGQAQGADGPIGGGGVLPVVDAQQRAQTGDVHDLQGRGTGLVGQHAAFRDIDATFDAPASGHRQNAAPAPARQFGVNAPADIVVDAQNGDLRRGAAREDARFRGDVVGEAAMALQMVGRDVEQHGHVADQRAHEVELEGGDFQHIDAFGGQRRQIQHRRADIAAQPHAQAGSPDQMGDQRGSGGFAVGAGHPHHPAGRARAREQLHIPEDLDPGGERAGDQGMGRGMGERDAGAEHQGYEVVPFDAVEIGQRHAQRGGVAAAGRIVVPGVDRGAAGRQRQRSGNTGTAQAEDGHGGAGVARKVDHRPISASAWRGRPAPAQWRRSRSGSRSSARPSPSFRSGGGSAPCGRRVCR